MLKFNSVNIHSKGSDNSDCKFGAWQKWEPVQLVINKWFGEMFDRFH